MTPAAFEAMQRVVAEYRDYRELMNEAAAAAKVLDGSDGVKPTIQLLISTDGVDVDTVELTAMPGAVADMLRGLVFHCEAALAAL